jgi:hypothetical protein
MMAQHKDPNEEYRKSYENMHKKTQDGRLLPGHPNYQKPGYDQYGNYRGGAGSSACFPPGTLVWTPTGNRQIEALVAGDIVWSRNKSGRLEARQVLRLRVHKPQRLWELRLHGAEPILTTAVHSFRTNSSWSQARHIRSNHVLCGVDRYGRQAYYKVTASLPTAITSTVYNLVVEENFTFFAGHFLAHSFTYFRHLRAAAYCLSCLPAKLFRQQPELAGM